MLQRKSRIYALSLTLLILSPLISSNLRTAAGSGPVIGNYSLTAVPAVSQEGSTITLVLTVSNTNTGTSIKFSFRFNVRDPSGTTTQSTLQNYTTTPNQDSFSILVAYPSSTFPGSNSLVGTYSAWVDELLPIAATMVATTSFTLTITDNQSYERTLTVNMRASGYNVSESVTIAIRTVSSATIVFSRTVSASSAGIVSAAWMVPVNATIDQYTVTITGTSTFKNPVDFQKFSVRAATMNIPSISSSKSSYQRTETLQYSFQPKYPNGSIATLGVALLTLTRPDRANVTLAATYDSVSQTFTMSYDTFPNNETGTWTATLTGHAYSDPWGNSGPGTTLSSSPQLTPASMSVTVTTNNTIFDVGQMIRFNATITYPDGTTLQSGSVGAFLRYSVNQQTINDTVSVVYDTGLAVWVGTYTPQTSDVGGLWSLVVNASDGFSPPNTGSATRAITIRNGASPTSGNDFLLPLFYYGLIAGLVAGLLLLGFIAFRRHKTTHAKLKIDLEAVKSEAGKIENQEFFQSVKDQLKRQKDGTE